MIDFLPWVLTAASAVVTLPWLAAEAEPGGAFCAAATAAAIAAPLVLGVFLAFLRPRRSALVERLLLLFPYLAPAATVGALAAGRLPALVAARAPDLPDALALAAAEAVGFLAVLATLAGERQLFVGDGRFEPAPWRPRVRVAAVALATPVAAAGLLDALLRLDAVRIAYDSYAFVQLGLFLGMGALLVAALPRLVRLALPTRPLSSGPLRDAFDGIAAALGVRVRELRVVDTHHTLSNAALVGGFGPRMVLLTDRLVAEHPLEELAAVLGHELGHARGGHVTIFGLLVGALGAFSLAVPDAAFEWLGPLGSLAVALLVLLVFFRWVLGPVARLCEHDADVAGALTVGSHEPIRDSLERISGSENRHRASWRHPSVEDRVRFLEAALGDPEVAARSRRALRRVRAGAAVLLAAGSLVFIATRIGDLPAERVAHEIRAGRYDRALALAREHPGPPMERWEALARAAASTGVAGPDTVLERARAAFGRGDFEKAGLLGRVSALRTGRRTHELFAALAEAAADGDWTAVAAGLAGPASFLVRDETLGSRAAALAAEAAARAASAPGNNSKRMGT